MGNAWQSLFRVKGAVSTTLPSNGAEENLQTVACVLPRSEFLLVRREETSHLREDPNETQETTPLKSSLVVSL